MSTTAGGGRSLTIVQAMREALREEMLRDPEVFVMGEDVRISRTSSPAAGPKLRATGRR